MPPVILALAIHRLLEIRNQPVGLREIPAPTTGVFPWRVFAPEIAAMLGLQKIVLRPFDLAHLMEPLLHQRRASKMSLNSRTRMAPCFSRRDGQLMSGFRKLLSRMN